MDYTIEVHNHNLAAWVAATAARASNRCRFSVQAGKKVLEDSGFTPKFDLSSLPSQKNTDGVHKEWRGKVIEAAQAQGIAFTNGIAAKLINCYLKARFVCGGHHAEESVKALHPPIDAILLAGLIISDPPVPFQNEWEKHRNTRWSKLNSKDYQAIIDLVRKTMKGQPLWMVEEYWKGHQ